MGKDLVNLTLPCEEDEEDEEREEEREREKESLETGTCGLCCSDHGCSPYRVSCLAMTGDKVIRWCW